MTHRSPYHSHSHTNRHTCLHTHTMGNLWHLLKWASLGLETKTVESIEIVHPLAFFVPVRSRCSGVHADYCKSLLWYTVDNACSFKKRKIVMWMITKHTQKKHKTQHSPTDRQKDIHRRTYTWSHISPSTHTHWCIYTDLGHSAFELKRVVVLQRRKFR